MKTTLNVILAASILAACSSTPEATEAEATANATTEATATAEIAPQPTAVAFPTTTATATASAAPAPEPAADIVVVAMKITLDPKTSMELKADKGLYVKGKKVAAFDKNVLQLTDMKDSMAVWKDGSIIMTPASPKKMKFNDKDEVEIEGGGKIAIDDKGKVTLTLPDAKDPAKAPKPVITGFKPEARRAATIGLIMALMSTSSTDKSGPTTASAAPAASAAPPKK